MRKTTIIVVLALITTITTVSCGEKKLSKKEQEALDGKLMLAGLNGYTKEVKTFIEQGGDVNVVTPIDEKTILHIAAEKGYKEIAKLLLNHEANVHVKDHLKRTPLDLVAEQNNVEMAKLLLEKGADVNSGQPDNETPLYYAAYNGNDEMCRFLIAHGADITAKTDDGFSILHGACAGDIVWLVKKLIKIGVDVNEKENNICSLTLTINPPLDIELIKLLVDNGADLNDQTWHFPDKGPALLHILVGYSEDIISGSIEKCKGKEKEELEKILWTMQYLINNGANPYALYWMAGDGFDGKVSPIDLVDKRTNPKVYRLLKNAMRQKRR